MPLCYPQLAGFHLSSAPRLHQHPLVLSFTCMSHRCGPPTFTFNLLARSKAPLHGITVQSQHTAGTCLGAALGAQEISLAESILNMHHLGDSFSQMGPDTAKGITFTRWCDHIHKYNMDMPGSSHTCGSWRLNLRGNSLAFCEHTTLKDSVLLPPHPSPQPPPLQHTLSLCCKSFTASLLSFCLHSTLCSGSYRCSWNINSNIGLIINPARRWTAQAQSFVSQSSDSIGATFSMQPHFSVYWAAGKGG